MIEKISDVLLSRRTNAHMLLAPDGWYYLTASTPAFDGIELRRARTLEALPDAPARIVWTKPAFGIMSRLVRSPQLHLVDGSWCIYFAAGEAAGQHSMPGFRLHCIRCDGDPLLDEWGEASRIDTGWDAFSIDPTTFTAAGRRYFCWAQQNAGLPGSSNLYMAEMRSAARLKLPGILLTVPEHDWECTGCRGLESPAVLRHNGRLFLTYSTSAADDSRAMGMLSADEHDDLLRRENWEKSPTPMMSTDASRRVYGPGSGSFTKDSDGRDLLLFQARPEPGFECRCHVRPVEYDEAGRPVFH